MVTSRVEALPSLVPIGRDRQPRRADGHQSCQFSSSMPVSSVQYAHQCKHLWGQCAHFINHCNNNNKTEAPRIRHHHMKHTMATGRRVSDPCPCVPAFAWLVEQRLGVLDVGPESTARTSGSAFLLTVSAYQLDAIGLLKQFQLALF